MKKLCAAAVLCLSVVTTSLTAAAPANAAVPPLGSCSGHVAGVNSAGVPASYYLDRGVGRVETYGPGTLGFVPRDTAGAPWFGFGGGPGTLNLYWFALSGNTLYEISQASKTDANAHIYSTSYTKRVIGTSWSGIRQISFSQDRAYLYALTTAGGINRYRVSGAYGARTVATDQIIATSGWGSLKTFTTAGSKTLNGVTVDAFTAVIGSTGELVQYAFPRANPKSWSRKQLKSSGWGGMATINTDFSCADGFTDGGMIGVTTQGSVYAYYDANQNNFSGTDISSLGRIATSLPFTPFNE
ncbi:tachylectin-related carbohydrate-binding protein [Aeromicrobium sp.]|uniref:tachylectin-related carbohydrate-binding protein n=1 Tax=Aeromicrobium sp. TaxID=1871063 RepID=UPI0030C1DA06